MSSASLTNLVDTLRQRRLVRPEHLTEVTSRWKQGWNDPRPLAKLLVQRGWLTVYQMNRVLKGGAQELVFGSYRILDGLGQGGQSQVYKARHADNDWLVALKVF